MSKLKIAIQKSGRLSEKSFSLFKECGIQMEYSERKLMASASNFPLDVLFLRDDDIPEYIEKGVADIGIIGENILWEKNADIQVIKKLGFASCRLSLAIPKDETYVNIHYFQSKRIATSYPNILRSFFETKNITAEIETISGSVEIATGIGLADGIFDIVSSGSTLMMNGLKEVEVLAKSEAVLVGCRSLSPQKNEILEKLVFRLDALQNAKRNKYILLNAPNNTIPKIIEILPGMKSPTILPLAEKGWSSLHSVVEEDKFWDIIDQLKALGAQGILVVPIEKMIL